MFSHTIAMSNLSNTLMIYSFFFFNQQFITWDALADCGSYFITTYIKTESTCEKKIKIKKENENEKKMEKN